MYSYDCIFWATAARAGCFEEVAVVYSDSTVNKIILSD